MQGGPPHGLYEPFVTETSSVVRRHSESGTVSEQWSLKICLAVPWGNLVSQGFCLYYLGTSSVFGPRLFPLGELALL